MSNRKGENCRYFTVLIMLVGFLLLIGGLIVLASFPAVNLIAIPIIGFVIFISGLYFFNNIYSKKQKKKKTNTRQFVDPNLNRQSKRVRSKRQKIHYLYIKDTPPEGAICLISKTTIEEKDDVLKCPYCDSFFLSTYLKQWLEENKRCPVCTKKLKIIER